MAKTQKLTVKVIPRASRDEVIGFQGDVLKVKLRAPPVDGAANEALKVLFAWHFGLKRSQIRVIRGEKSRLKLVEIG